MTTTGSIPPGDPVAQLILQLTQIAAQRLDPRTSADIPGWRETIDAILRMQATGGLFMKDDLLHVGRQPTDKTDQERLAQLLKRLHPWRKGPISAGGVFIDTEWRSDWKWNRVISHLRPLHGTAVLDVGCGNGYYALRMALAGARAVLGIDPYLLNVFQFQALNALCGEDRVTVLPLRAEDLPHNAGCFDLVFSMGLLYHRRQPLEHLLHLRSLANANGEVVVETLVIETPGKECLRPQDRYAGMRNVWCIPSVPLLVQWMKDAGLVDVRVVDVTKTTEAEQRATAWMTNSSLKDALDPADDSRTIEGHPAPLRAVAIGRVPSQTNSRVSTRQ